MTELTIMEMQNNIIKYFGFENEITIRFFWWCESELPYPIIKTAYEKILKRFYITP